MLPDIQTGGWLYYYNAEDYRGYGLDVLQERPV